MTQKDLSQGNGLLNPAEPVIPKIIFDDNGSNRSSLVGSVMDDLAVDSPSSKYNVLHRRWVILGLFVMYSASNSLQWTQYTIIQNVVVKYYGVSSNLVSWTSMVYMVTYVPLIFPASWFLDKTTAGLVGIIVIVTPTDEGPSTPPQVSDIRSKKELPPPHVSENALPTKRKLPVYVVYPQRWRILILFSLSSAASGLHWTQYTIIQDVVVPYYGVSSYLVYWTSLIIMLLYIVFMPPGSWFLAKTDLRVTTILGAFGTCLGAWLKVFSVPQHMFWLGFMGQTVVSIAQVFILNVPPRLAAVWFGANQVSSACSVGVFGNQLGVAIGFFMPPMLVRATGTTEEIAGDFRLMFYLVAGFTSVLFVFIVLFFKAAPPTPPSAAADLGNSLDSNFLQSLKKLITNRNYVLLLISYGLNVGTFYAISTLLNQVILIYYPTAHTDAGRIGLVIVMAGMAGSVVCGIILDKTHRFKETTFAVYAASSVGMVIFTFTLDCGYISIVYLSSILLGFFMTGYLPVGFELASEVTYPEPEGTTSGLLNAVVQVFGIITTLLYEWMLTAAGDLWSNLMLCGILTVGTGITAAIKSDLRRQAAQNRAAEIDKQ